MDEEKSTLRTIGTVLFAVVVVFAVAVMGLVVTYGPRRTWPPSWLSPETTDAGVEETALCLPYMNGGDGGARACCTRVVCTYTLPVIVGDQIRAVAIGDAGTYFCFLAACKEER